MQYITQKTFWRCSVIWGKVTTSGKSSTSSSQTQCEGKMVQLWDALCRRHCIHVIQPRILWSETSWGPTVWKKTSQCWNKLVKLLCIHGCVQGSWSNMVGNRMHRWWEWAPEGPPRTQTFTQGRTYKLIWLRLRGTQFSLQMESETRQR